MPELQEYMYCSQQICIPPTFPYILRQYAKAAIRTQPVDLLRWSTAYFRCLALNLPPPVKVRLEYPIPRDHHGVTPGWLKVLLYQLGKGPTVSFKVLWDRWMGAALEHETLIKILCLGGFDNPEEIPFLRFIALCASHLTDNLTQTMILFCEIITEEPEGASAMICLEPFVDAYKFLAEIDASESQILLNIHFTDSALGLFPEEKKEKPPTPPPEVVSVGSIISAESEEEGPEGTEVEEGPAEDLTAVVSCPDIGVDDFKTDEDELKLLQDTPTEVTPEASVISEQKEEVATTEEHVEEEEESSAADEGEAAEEDASQKVSTESLSETDKKESDEIPAEAETKAEDEGGASHTEEEGDEDREFHSAETLVGMEQMPQRKVSGDELQPPEEGGEKEEIPPEEEEEEYDDEFEKFKKAMMLPRTESELEKIARYDAYRRGDLEPTKSSITEESAVEEEEKKYEEVYVDAVKGIGPIVPEKLMNAAIDYFKEVSKEQHGMVMPRNIRHYQCPPLEILEENKEDTEKTPDLNKCDKKEGDPEKNKLLFGKCT